MSPRLTVVVPVHNGAEHLWECLASVAAQTLRELDVVVVDDGSTDAGPDIAAAFAERDARFRVVRQHNGGTGHARNTGTRHAAPGTEYLAFADSADVLPRRAYERLVGLLDGSGSDFATGNVYRLTAAGRSQAWQHRHLRRTRTATHITEDLGLLSDHTAWNKVFRRTFWDRHRLAFPEGVLYEDTPLTIPAHFLAEAVDVLHEHVYYWRVREGAGPRRRTDPQVVRDRIASVDHVSRFLADPANTRWSAHKRDYDRSVLTEDLPHFVDRLPTAGADYRDAFMDRARDWASRVDPELFKELPVDLRVKWQLIRERRLAELIAVLEYERRNASGFLVHGLPLRKRAVLPGADGTPVPLPSSVTRLTSEDFPVRAGVREILWRDGTLVIRGYAYIRNLGAPSRLRTRKTALVTSGRHRLLVPLRTVHMPEATHNSRQERHCYDWSGFEITVDPQRLKGDERWRPGRWQVDVVVAASGVVRRAPLRSLGTGSGAWPPPGGLGDGTRLVPWFKNGRLLLSVEWAERRLTGHRAVHGGIIELDVTDESAREPVALRLTHRGSGSVLETPVTCRLDDYEGVRATARLRLADLTAARPAPGEHPEEVRLRDTSSWDAVLVLADSRTARITTAAAPRPGRYPLADGRELIVAATADEYLVLHDRTPQPIADRVAWQDDGSLTVEGELPASAPAELELVLRHSTHAAEVTFPCERRDADGGARDGKGTASDEATGPAERPPAPGRAGPAAGCGGGCECGGRAPEGAPADRAGQRFTAGLWPGAAPTPSGTAPLREGRWYLYLRGCAGGAGGVRDTGEGMPVRLAPELFAGLPEARTVGGKTVTVDRRFHDRVFIEAGSAVPLADRGPYRQRLLRERTYPARAALPLLDTVLYSSFGGRRYSDSPRAVHEELVRRGTDVEHLWVVRDRQFEVPPTARALVLGSAEWYEALARSRRIVTNTHLPPWFRRREGQYVLQTWHGTPLKRIGADLAGTLCAELAPPGPPPDPGAQWSTLLSANPHSTRVLRRALGYQGEIAETGLPRTDAFFAPDRAERAAALRRRLGIPRGKRVVLYAPTQRDERAYDTGHYRLHLPLNVARAESALGADHVLLVRSHPLVADQVPARRGPFLRDVSAHPDAAGVLLAADVLVTDYSSLAVDFANTGRPLLYLTPDLARFRDTVRGFTADFESEAPGPQLSGTDDLVDALRDVEGVARGYAAAYRRFRAAYCPWDDGGATARAVDGLLAAAP
ncbi:CDP-glycerol glycerophosphotransferase family protein [Streptomyces sp. NPDC050610]|uniref:bifunctional glycosyltransferase/CDP-glycerol:glycerophosphate glycerophosphotransferase n=1 Tax=Streptomyces sp. NPDC050610 TaxID=3157097 RepID=UPI003416A786